MTLPCFYSRLLGMLIVVLQSLFVAATCSAQKAETALPPTFKLGILVSSDANQCYKSGVLKAIRSQARKGINTVNMLGGIHGRQVELEIFDDREDPKKTLEIVKRAIADPALIGLIGLGNSTRGRYVFDRIGEQIGASRLPFVTDISVSQIYAPYGNVFSMASAVDDELEVVRAFLKDKGISRPAFIGIKGDLYSASLGDGLAHPASQPALAMDRRIKISNYSIEADTIIDVVREVDKVQADMIILAIQSGPGAEILKQLAKVDIHKPILVLYGRIDRILRKSKNLPDNLKFYQLGRDGVPHVYNERLRQLIWTSRSQAQWIFEDTRNPANTSGWAKGGYCKSNEQPGKRQIFGSANRRAIARGMQYRDILNFMIKLAQDASKVTDMRALRNDIVRALNGYFEGRQVYKGLWQNWTFTKNRAVASDILIDTSSTDPQSIALAPIQYRRVNASIVKSPVVDMSIDLIHLARIDSNERKFDAEFYLSLKSIDNQISIDALDFTNAARSQFGRARLITDRALHDGGAGSRFPEGVKVYKISGTFHFTPELDSYPFDTQRLSISFQSANAGRPFLIQPLAQHLRKMSGTLDGWVLKDQYVGSQQDIISTISTNSMGPQLVPIYKFNQTWVAQRISTDYYIRVIVPLGFILLVTYFSVFLPSQRFDSIIAIQVTALLSSIALYLALPKVDTDQATLSDKMFILTYAAVAMMIGLTILNDSLATSKRAVMRWGIATFQRCAFPLIMIAVAGYLIAATGVDAGYFLEQSSAPAR